MKIAFVASESVRGREALAILLAQYPAVSPSQADVIVALGGDGFLLHTLHTYPDLEKPIYGMNRGTIGFLMNAYDENDLLARIDHARANVLRPLQMTALTDEGAEHKALAFNEVALIRYSAQSANIQLRVNERTRIEKLICDGILVSTAAGSTAYNFSAGGPIVPLGAQVLALTPVSPFRPRRWHGALVPHDAVVEFVNLDPVKRPLGAAADGHEVTNIVSVRVQEDRNQSVRVLFDPDHSLEDRVFSEQFAY